MDMIFKREFTAEKDRLSLFEIAEQFQKSAEGHVEILGLESEKLMEDNILWVLIRSEIHIFGGVHRGERITVETWPGITRHSFYPRRFIFTGEDGRTILTCASMWALMDSETRKMSDHPKAKELVGIRREGEQKMPSTKKVFPELVHSMSRKVKSDEIDINGHLNNCCYLGYVEEIISDKFEPSEIWIEYIREVFEGETVEIKYTFEDDCFYGAGMCGDEPAFYVRAKK